MSIAPLDHPGPWTFDDLEQLPENDLLRFEVVDGTLLVSPAPSEWHQAIARRLLFQFARQDLQGWEPVYEVAFCVGSDGRVPDLALIRTGIPVPPRGSRYPLNAFGLLVEVVSPSSRGMDRILKPAEYAAASVPFYWRVETEPEVEIIAFALESGAYREVTRLASGTADLPAPIRLTIDVDGLRG